MSYYNLRDYFLSFILATFFILALIVIIYLNYQKRTRLGRAGLTPEDIYRQPRLIFLRPESQAEFYEQAREEKKEPIIPKEVEPYVFYCSDCDITSLGYDVYCPVCAKRMKQPQLATPKDQEKITCIICHSKNCPVCEKSINGDDACFEECPYCERSYHKHCWEKTMQVFGKCGQCLEKPPDQLVDGAIKPEERVVEEIPQVEYETQENFIPLFREDLYANDQSQNEQVMQYTQSNLTITPSERLRKFKRKFKESLLKFKEKLLEFKEKVKIYLDKRKSARIILQENPPKVKKREQIIESKLDVQSEMEEIPSLIEEEVEEIEEAVEIIDLELLIRESYLEGLPKIDIKELNRESYLERLPKINIDDLNREIALEKKYATETGKHAIWRGKKTKGYLKWKEDKITSDNKS